MSTANGLFSQVSLEGNAVLPSVAGCGNRAQLDAVAAAAAFLAFLGGSEAGGQGQSSSGTNATAALCASPSPPLAAAQLVTTSSPRGNHWIRLGIFDTEAEMQSVRNKEKVSKRRTEQLKNGVKVRYRCNTWKRTKCAFQMFSFYNAESGKIELYECGVHDHTGRRKLEYELNGPQRRKASATVNNSAAAGESTKAANGAKANGFGLSAALPEAKAGKQQQKSQAGGPTAHNGEDSPFTLKDRTKFEQLRDMATEHGLKLQRDSDQQLSVCVRGRMALTVSDCTDCIQLNSLNGAQRWAKADWEQFLWAMRGIFAYLAKYTGGGSQQPQQ